MNVMLAAGGHPWTVLPVETRDRCMSALETASVEQDIGLLAEYLADLVQVQLQGKPEARTPTN